MISIAIKSIHFKTFDSGLGNIHNVNLDLKKEIIKIFIFINITYNSLFLESLFYKMY